VTDPFAGDVDPRGPSVDPHGGAAYSFGGAPLRKGIDRDPHNLLPGFAVKVEALFQRLRARGYKPLLWEGLRTPARAAELERRGTGSARSIHCLGAAVDIVDEQRKWGASADFWQAIGQEAAALGLTWGGLWRKRDLPHVQAISVAEQAAFRLMSEGERAERVA
jgi:peptidoglycan L-alanyl-D-glutamate endopeptidase CwlK